MKRSTKILIGAGVGLAVIGGVGLAFAAGARELPPKLHVPTERQAIDAAIARGGTPDKMTSVAYWASHPECPHVIDPEDPEHADCMAIWLRLREQIAKRVAEQRPADEKPAADECDPLDPDTWKPGHLCFLVDGRWVNVPEEEVSEEEPADECDPLDPDTWGDGYVCTHDGERWVRVPEAGEYKWEECTYNWIRAKLPVNVLSWHIRCYKQMPAFAGDVPFPGTIPRHAALSLFVPVIESTDPQANREVYLAAMDSLARIARRFPTIAMKVGIRNTTSYKRCGGFTDAYTENREERVPLVKLQTQPYGAEFFAEYEDMTARQLENVADDLGIL